MNLKHFANIKAGKQSAIAIAFCMYLIALLMNGSNGIVASGISLSSSEIVFFRMAIGTLFLAAVFFGTRRKFTVLQNKRELALLVGAGAAISCELLFVYEAYRTAGVGMATILCYLGPIAVMALSPILFRERLTIAKGVGFAVVVFGSLLVNISALGGGTSITGIFCGLASAAGLAAMIILNKMVTKTPGLERSLIQLGSCAVICGIYLAVTKGLPQVIADTTAGGQWPAAVLVGALAAIANLLYFSAVAKLPAQRVAVCGYLEPLSAVLMSVVILGEQMLPLQVIGAALIIGGALFGEAAGKKRAGASARPKVVFRPLRRRHAA